MTVKYRVWALSFKNTLDIITNWMTYSECKKFCLSRWGHYPPWSFISSAKNEETFRRKNNIKED